MQNITHQALLSDQEIKQLIQQAGLLPHSIKLQQQFSNAGDHSANSLGSGLDFADRRPYEAGDDPRFIDWRASARSSQTLVRRFYAEQAKPNCIVIDRTSSMLFGTKTRLKLTQTLRYGVYSGAQIIQSGQQLACYIAEQQPYWQTPSDSLLKFTHTMQHAARAYPPDFQVQHINWSQVSDFLIQKLPQGSRLVVISDFHSAKDNKALQALAHQFDLNLICVSDEAEHASIAQPVHLFAPNFTTHQTNKTELKLAISQFQQQLTQRLSRLNASVQYIQTDDEFGIQAN